MEEKKLKRNISTYQEIRWNQNWCNQMKSKKYNQGKSLLSVNMNHSILWENDT